MSEEDPLQQGFRVIQNAYHANVLKLEQELKGLKISHEELKGQAAQLQRRNSTLEVELVEGHQKCQQLSDENKELFKQVGQLRRQILRLEGLKKKVMESMSDDGVAIDDGPHHSYEGIGYSGGLGGASHFPETSSYHHGSGIAQEGLGRAPWSAAAPSAAPSSAPPGSSVDGKQFFRNARNNLSYEAFNEFLANIKRLNNQQQTREETLEEARRIFGSELAHLYREFEQLLNRHTI
mmetsp:Transcript_38366/g.90172  ORF Transcript_38366/g.90172 Transcript_38366/m.90172 type:complete len:236 (+) Transcript_38366:165-872(+)